MKTLYVDVYFLINFTVDILSLYFACRISGATVKKTRLTLASLLAALSACAVVILNITGMLFVVMLLITSALVGAIAARPRSVLTRLKLSVSFCVFETAIGGAVTAMFNFLDKYLSPKLTENEFGAKNRSLLLIALMILLAYFSIRLTLSIFKGSGSERCVSVRGEVANISFEASGLVDSGNLLRDPLTNTEVVVMKRNALEDLARAVDNAVKGNNTEISRRIRLIPSESIGGERLLFGIRCDTLNIENIEIKDAVIAIDGTKGSFGGYDALVPPSLFEGET